MKFRMSMVQEFVCFVTMLGFWFVVWFATDLLHHYY